MPRTPPPIAVVGSDLSARIAALRLKRAQRRVLWYDASPLNPGAGGGDARAAGTAEPSPLAPMLPLSAPTLLGLVAELGISKSVHRTEPTAALLEPAPSLLSWSAGLRDPLAQGLRGPLARRRARRLLRWYAPWIDPNRPERGARLDDRSVTDWCRLYLGRKNVDELLGPCLGAWFGLAADVTSRLFGLSLLDASGRPRATSLTGAAELSRRLDAELADVRQHETVRAVERGGRRLQLTNGRARNAAATILAVPAYAVAAYTQDLTPAECASLAKLCYQDQLQLRVRLSRRQARSRGSLWVSDGVPGPIAAILEQERSETAGIEELERVIVARPSFARTALSVGANETVEMLRYAAERLIPGDWHGARFEAPWFGSGALPAFQVGHYRAIERLQREQAGQVSRALFLCGDYQVAPHLEGAAIAGSLAAERALNAPASRP